MNRMENIIKHAGLAATYAISMGIIGLLVIHFTINFVTSPGITEENRDMGAMDTVLVDMPGGGVMTAQVPRFDNKSFFTRSQRNWIKFIIWMFYMPVIIICGLDQSGW